ncbi:MAG: PDZ domain-containing protein [Planctomycetes bacterium]|nr:PDZ domain-containing protein [Planctomycetota bacterium]
MKSQFFIMLILPILIIVFALGVFYVSAQDAEKKEGSDKKDTEAEKAEKDEKAEKEETKELSEEELKAKVAELVKKLESDDFKEREAATEELFKLGMKVIPIIKEAIEKATDPEIKSKLSSVIEKYEQLKKEAKEKKSKLPFRAPGFTLKLKLGDITNKIDIVFDDTGTYSMQKLEGGKVKVTATPKGGEKETREFESMKEFEEEWPEIYEKFNSKKVHPAQPPKGFDDDKNDEEDSQPNEIPEFDNDDEMPERPEGFPEGLNDKEKEMERMKKEMEKRFGKESSKEFDPKRGEEGQYQLYRSSRTDSEGNTYKLIIENGKVTAEYKSKGGETITKHYENVEEFKKGWKEFAELFPHIDEEYKPYEPSETKPKGLGRVEDAVLDVVSTVLRAQLQIKEGEGLLIRELVGELDENKGLFKNAGFEKYDILLAVNGKSITKIETVKNALAELKPGGKLVIKYIRKGTRQEITITK